MGTKVRTLLLASLSTGCWMAWGCAGGEDPTPDAGYVPIDSGKDVVVDTATDVVDSATPDVPDTATPDATGDSDATLPDAPSDGSEVSDAIDSTPTDAADTGGATDSAVSDADTGDAPAPYRHTIVIDGTTDFTSSAEKFTTTSSAYSAYVTWDATALYVGYSGPDIGSGATANKWVFVYLDTDPGASTGATTGEKYTNQRPKFGTGFGAEYYFAWKTNESYSQFKKYGGGAWATATTTITVKRDATVGYVEMKIPFADLGAVPAKLGVTTFMLNEVSGGEWSYAGLYSGSFTDGKYDTTDIPITYWLQADLSSAAAPNATANRKP